MARILEKKLFYNSVRYLVNTVQVCANMQTQQLLPVKPGSLGCPGTVPRIKQRNTAGSGASLRYFHQRGDTCRLEVVDETSVSAIFKQGLQRHLLTWMP